MTSLQIVPEPDDDYDPPPAPAPDGLGEAGARLWDAAMDARVFAVHEELVLLQACRTADLLDRLAVLAVSEPVTVEAARGRRVTNPVLVEQRQQSYALARLLMSLRLPALADGGEERMPQRRVGFRGLYQPGGQVST